MSFLINIPNRPLDKLIERLKQDIPEQEIEVWPNVQNPQKVEFALVWKHQQASLVEYPNLKGISSFGAGVDSIITDPQLPDVPVARIIDPVLAKSMAAFVLTIIQQHKLRLPQFRQQQKQTLWKPKSPRRNNTVGILGFGQLGQETGRLLTTLGYSVFAWSQSSKNVEGIVSVTGSEGLREVVSKSDYLVCLLPLTKTTENILDIRLFQQMPKGSVLINVARGDHLVDQDLLKAIEQGCIESAYLDVFRQEPLPSDHVFWQHPNIHITPHISAVTNVETAVTQIVNNYHRVKTNQNMVNTIDKNSGY